MILHATGYVFKGIGLILVICGSYVYKVAVNLELESTEPFLLGDTQGQVLVSLWSHFCQPMDT